MRMTGKSEIPPKVIISAELRGKKDKTDLFNKSVKKDTERDMEHEMYGELHQLVNDIDIDLGTLPETLDLVPDFVVAYNEEKLRAQHATFGPVDKVVIRTDSEKIIDLKENLNFSYSSAINSYVEANYSETGSKAIEYNWQSYAVGATNYKWQKLSDVGPHKETRCSIVGKANKHEYPPPLQWIFEAEDAVQVNQLLLFVKSDDSVIWTVEVWMPDTTKPISIELTPGLEKVDNLCQSVKSIVLTAQVPNTARLFDENCLKNQVSMLLAINQSAEAYLREDLVRPSEQHLTNGITITPDGNDVFTFNYSRLRPEETNRRDSRNTKGDSSQVNSVHGGEAKAFIENWNAFEFALDEKVGHSVYIRPTDATKLKEHQSLRRGCLICEYSTAIRCCSGDALADPALV